MQTLIESLKNLKESDFYECVNLHIHTKFSDGVLDPVEIPELALKQGMKIISITDHNSTEAYKYLDKKYEGLEIITGVEFDCWYKSNFVHILGYGIDIHNQALHSLCAKDIKGTRLDLVRFFNKREATEVIRTIKEAGGISVLAHPACCWNANIKKMFKELKLSGLDGIEAYYPYLRHRGLVKFHSAGYIKKAASEIGFILTGGNDCHDKELRWKDNQ